MTQRDRHTALGQSAQDFVEPRKLEQSERFVRFVRLREMTEHAFKLQ